MQHIGQGGEHSTVEMAGNEGQKMVWFLQDL